MLAWLGAVLAWLGAAPAWAQGPGGPDLTPRIVLVFDTSGSMGVDVATGEATGGDSSLDHPGDGRPSRLFVAKNAVATLLATTSEVHFALLRYPQREALGLNRGAIDGFQQNQYLGLAERPLNYGGACDGLLALPPGASPEQAAATATSLLVPFDGFDAEAAGGANVGAILRWLDHREAWPADRELRADGPTPVVASLRLAAEYLRQVLASDPLAACRRYQVVLLTDGGESCVPEAERAAALAAVAAELRGLRVQPAGGGAEVPVEVRTFVVAFGVNQNAAEALGGLARAGGTAVDANGDLDLRRGLPYRANDLDGLRLAFSRILRAAVPVEVCDGLDDDCDGRIDEGALNACGVCGPPPVEVCNRRDDDCDGRVDEGALNACGACGAPPAEVCNDRDDDCDGAVDEGLPPNCVACVPGAVEVCNGLDDDCDGRVDNLAGAEAPLTRPCGRALGACTEGVQACVAGVFGPCDGVAPAAETCDGRDEDCDGAVDEDTRPCGAALEVGEVGECRLGRRRCDAAGCADNPALCAEDGWLRACEGAIDPRPEGCNGLDDDCDGAADEGLFNACGFCGPSPPETCDGRDDTCDGRVDEDARCPARHRCLAGECVQPCDTSGECAGGFRCVLVYPGGAFCHPNLCALVRCAPGTRCEAASGACEDPCRGVTCAAGQGCDLGTCVPATCRHTGCPVGQRCRGDACAVDPCAEVACETDRFCREGACVGACLGVACAAGEVCEDGTCRADACGGRCVPGQTCDPADGACVADACYGLACPVGTACVAGVCRADAPCVGLVCPAGTTCVGDGQCTDGRPTTALPAPRVDQGAPADGALPDAGARDAGRGDAEDTPRDGGSDQAGSAPDAAPTRAPGAGGCQGLGDADPPRGAAWALLALLAVSLRARRRARGALVLLVGGVFGGCGEEMAPEAADAAPVDRGAPDVALADAGSGCVPSPEVCNGRDDDCDGLVDAADPELALALLTDLENCGACGRVCAAPAAEVGCQGGACVLLACAPGFTDFNGDGSDGCEAACVVTGGGVERCDDVDNDCDGRVDEETDRATDVTHCGACGVVCPARDGGEAVCRDGRCGVVCAPGRLDLDGAVENGCEYVCEPRAVSGVGAGAGGAGDEATPTEICNGLDDDCDGRVDEADGLLPPPGDCLGLGVCAAECAGEVDCAAEETCAEGLCLPRDGGPTDLPCAQDAECQAAHRNFGCLAVAGAPSAAGLAPPRVCQARRATPQCDADRGARCLRPLGWQFGAEAGRCDGRDNDCDGRVDEDFAADLFEADRSTPARCAVGLGVCQRAGVQVCGPDGLGAVCSAQAGAPRGADDQCDGLDDDCDGRVDEGFADAWVALAAGGSIYAHEASRPGATAADDGRLATAPEVGAPPRPDARACGRAGVLPWAEVDFAEAEAACAAAGARLCTGAEWQGACGGPSHLAWTFGAEYVAGRCNDGARDAEPATPGQQSAPWPTGAGAACVQGGAYDLAGNLKEWTAEVRAGLRVVRGGSHQTRLPEGLRCDQADDLKAADFRHPGLGFRCCRDAPP